MRTHPRRSPIAAVALMALVGLVATLVGPRPLAAQASDDPLAAHMQGLGASEQALFRKVAAGELCPCRGAAASLKRCLEKPKPCAAASRTAAKLREWVASGLGYGQVVDELIRFVEEQAQQPQSFDLAQTACKGKPDAAAVVVSFSDFECPHCRHAAVFAEELFKEHDGRMRLCFKHFPLSYHLNARYAATVAVLLRGRDKFWPFHDRMFELANDKQLSEETIRAAAAQLGVPLESEAAALKAATAVVQQDREEGTAAGVAGTPSFFVNGRALPDEQPLEQSLRAAVAAALGAPTKPAPALAPPVPAPQAPPAAGDAQ